jgi:hypothetical protein
MTDILAIDLATTAGIARGKVGAEPTAETVKFAKSAGARDDAVFAKALSWASGYLKGGVPDLIFIEAMLPPEAMHGHTSRAVRDRLAGLHAVIRAVAYLRGCYQIEAANVGDIRAHFIGERGLRRDAAKSAVFERCQQLGWNCDNENESDALALWSYACAQIDPATALRVSPLFNRALRSR